MVVAVDEWDMKGMKGTVGTMRKRERGGKRETDWVGDQRYGQVTSRVRKVKRRRSGGEGYPTGDRVETEALSTRYTLTLLASFTHPLSTSSLPSLLRSSNYGMTQLYGNHASPNFPAPKTRINSLLFGILMPGAGFTRPTIAVAVTRKGLGAPSPTLPTKPYRVDRDDGGQQRRSYY